MKKIALSLLALAMLLSLGACSNNEGNENVTTNNNEQITIPDNSEGTYGDVTFEESTTSAAVEIPADQLNFTETNDQVRVVAEAANVRTDTSMSQSAIQGQAKKDTILTRTGYCGEWYRVLFEDKVCYIRASVVVLVEEETTYDAPKKMYVTASSLTVRSTTDFASQDNAIGYVFRGDVVDVVAAGNGWYRIIFSNQWYDKVEAYVGSKFISENAPETLAEEATTAVAK